jgi:hypothetical protein
MLRFVNKYSKYLSQSLHYHIRGPSRRRNVASPLSNPLPQHPPPAVAAVVAGSSVAAASTHLPTARLPPCLHLPTLSIRMPPPSRLLPPPPAEPVNSCWTNYSLARLRQKTGLCQGMPPVCCRPPFLQTSYDAKARSLWRPRAPDPVTLLRLPRPCLVAGIWSSGWVMAWLHQDSWPMLGVLARHRARYLG